MNNLQSLCNHLGIDYSEDLDFNELLEKNSLVWDDYNSEFIAQDDSVYCEREGLTVHVENSFWCNFSEECFSENFEGISIGHKILSSYWVDVNRLDKFSLVQLRDGDIIEKQYARYVEEDNAWYHEDECYYWESDGEYHLDPEEEEEEENLFSYHSGKRTWHCSPEANYRIGIEIEKEDREVKNEISAIFLFNSTGWACERDGSLDSNIGFEAISPVYDLFETDFENEFSKISNLINADYSKNCGGHLNLSSNNFDSLELFESLSSFYPLLYTIYPNRIGKNYCHAKPNVELKTNIEKYSSIYIKSSYILEFRIFPAVKNVKNLLWRLDLLKLFIEFKNSTFIDVVDLLLNKESKLYNHLNVVLPNERMFSVLTDYVKFVKQFGENLTYETIQIIEEKISKNKLN
jgi:hypothetical protein